ncbi:uncharacterized protein LOC128545857 [Mercenaria mercenaria]|uniref:uncharacterized protein LOC128545857 n=1 Tax=Mercenaria mercenaria TaxID=6596 RepID=UPI00234EC3AF|nr:uncharacterized protein LOC128545857 [Mercenaria mercenaria]
MEDYMDEWQILRSLVYKRYATELQSGTLTLEKVLKGLASQKLNNVTRVLDLLGSLPPTSVKNETTFSAMKLIKTKRRGRLNDDTLNDLTVVVLESPDIEQFNPDPAIQYWMMTPSGRKRRLQYERAATTTPQQPVPVVDTIVNLAAEVQEDRQITSDTQEDSQQVSQEEVSQQEDSQQEVSQQVSQQEVSQQEVSQQEFSQEEVMNPAFLFDKYDADDGYSSDESECDMSEDYVTSMLEMFSRE